MVDKSKIHTPVFILKSFRLFIVMYYLSSFVTYVRLKTTSINIMNEQSIHGLWVIMKYQKLSSSIKRNLFSIKKNEFIMNAMLYKCNCSKIFLINVSRLLLSLTLILLLNNITLTIKSYYTVPSISLMFPFTQLEERYDEYCVQSVMICLPGSPMQQIR